MSRHMRTTIRLNDALLEEAKREAHRRGLTLTALIERGLRQELINGARKQARRVELPVSSKGGGMLPGLNLKSASELLEITDPEGSL